MTTERPGRTGTGLQQQGYLLSHRVCTQDYFAQTYSCCTGANDVNAGFSPGKPAGNEMRSWVVVPLPSVTGTSKMVHSVLTGLAVGKDRCSTITCWSRLLQGGAVAGRRLGSVALKKAFSIPKSILTIVERSERHAIAARLDYRAMQSGLTG